MGDKTNRVNKPDERKVAVWRQAILVHDCGNDVQGRRDVKVFLLRSMGVSSVMNVSTMRAKAVVNARVIHKAGPNTDSCP